MKAIAIIALLSAVALPSVHAAEVCAIPHFSSLPGGFRYDFPPGFGPKGFKFAGEHIPLNRPDVRNRILTELNYLLLDRRSLVVTWLTRADALRPTINDVLKEYRLPREFIYLAAIESSYNSRALSSAGAYGYWQFIKSTATCGPRGCDEYDWKMNISRWHDDRADLVRSTHSAARYLAWMNRIRKVRLEGKQERSGFGNWLLATAAYNAGPARVTERMNTYGADSYWDIPLPIETERYVPRWIAIALISRYRTHYGVQARPRPKVAFDTVRKRLKKDLSVTAIARMLDTTPRVIWTLNSRLDIEGAEFPAKYRGKHIPHTINIPRGSKREFLAELKKNGY